MNRSCRRFCLTILLLACGSAHAVGDDRSLDAASARSLMTSLIFRHNHDTPFIQRQVSPLFAGVSEQHGILRIEGDGRLVMRILSPRQEMRVIESGTVTMTRRRTDGRQSTLSTRLDPRSEPQLVLLAIEALLLGNLAFLDEHFLLGGTAQPSGWSIELQPRADAGSTLTRIVLLGSDHQLRRLRAEFAGAQRQRWLEMDIVAASEAPLVTERRRALALAGASVLILAIALPRLQLGYDLGAFLPAARDDAQRVLVERLGQGPGAQLLFAVLPNVSHHDALAIAARLRARTEFTRVLPETFSPGIDAVPAAVWAHRLLLRDLPADIDGWRSVFGQRMDDIAFADDGMLRLITADPALASVEVLQTEAQDIADGELKTTDGSVIVAQTRSPAFDLSGQAAARAALEAELTGTPDARLLGSGVYGLQLQERIRHEATLYSVLASLVLLLLILWHFRSLAVTALVALPLVAGGAAGLLALTILFDVVHGITLAFGFTLLGVVIDYPLHVYTHRRGSGSHGASGLWSTLWTGVLSTLIAYAAFAFSGTNGLAQLGVFGLVGVAGGALATRWLVPPRPAGAPEPEAVLRPAGLRHRYWLAGLALSLPVLLTRPVFDDNLASLSPLDADTLRDDARLRQSLGVADLRHLVAIRLDDAEAVLHGTEVVMRRLEQAGFNAISVSTLLPSRHTQQQRRAVLKSLVAGQVVERALAQTPFDMAQFQPFFTALDTEAASSDTITYDTVTADPALAGIVTGRFYPADGNWVSLIFLRGTGSTEAVGPLLHDVPGATSVDLAESASALVRVYRTRLLEELGLAIGLIVVLLVAAGRGRQLVWTLGTVTATVCLGAAFAVVVQNGLSLFSLVALTLVAGLGLDYALFYARPQSETAMQLTTRAVGLCAFSSLAVFGILSFSDVPVLRGIGLPVAAGVLAAYVLSRFGRHTTSGT